MSSRSEPIPFFAEMSNVNPIFFLLAAFDEEVEAKDSILASLTSVTPMLYARVEAGAQVRSSVSTCTMLHNCRSERGGA